MLHTSGANILNVADLSSITTNNISNGVIIEFNFVSGGDSLSFGYLFAFQDYSFLTCSGYNDVFGFFISDHGINGRFTNNAENRAIVPGSANIPVSFNTVNNGTNAAPN